MIRRDIRFNGSAFEGEKGCFHGEYGTFPCLARTGDGTGLLCLLVMILWNYNQRYVNTWPLFSNPLLVTHYYRISELCFSLSFGLCVLALLFGSERLKRAFEWSPLRWIGMISYSLYMWHLPLLLVFIQWGQPFLRGWPPLLAYCVYWLWVLVVILPFCFLFFIWVEKPGMKFGERFNCQKETTATPASEASASVSEMPASENKKVSETDVAREEAIRV